MKATIILIGPICAGKSTIAALLAEKLGFPRYEMDEIRWKYYAEIGYDPAVAAQIVESSEGMLGLLRHWKPFEAYAVERVLADYPDCVHDFGAGHSVYEDENLFVRVEHALAPYPNVILLLPSPDLDESVEILNARFTQLLMRETGKVDGALLNLNEGFVRHPSNRKLAKMIVYTNKKTPADTCAEILQKLEI